MVIPQGVGDLGSWQYRANSRESGRQTVNQQAETVRAKVFGSSGRIRTYSPSVNGHISQMLTTLFPATANIRGTVEFDTPAGAEISVLGIRSPPALTFTTLPSLAK